MSASEVLPDQIKLGEGHTMTFLRNEPFLTRVHVAADAEAFAVPPHWHETHAEIFRVIKGQVEYTIGNVTKVYTPSDGEVLVPRKKTHAFTTFKGVETIFEERTTPKDDDKELFFRNAFADGFPKNPFNVFPAFYHGDAFFALPGDFRWLEKFLLFIFGGIIGPLLGYRTKYDSLKKV
ncbi:hypothetical protein SERLA73DRAFT_186091 [Serpula lacrymans var. lacrymans S7.3]|uniref:Cupin type-2 domain-containing protein n=2 Tax=Serpula lacrymans var. lacrymans TaxID=341189 RepID=F8Q6X8_SERL3|nr:uncharacterized protein SERLADRAFT_474951 [Serpula lacrymans var. lacrymans S7.9]EGN96366.1 hypothetical protein SERLA73DRAFT_186091 [Serpula lacrymans var. lacrymans S7.3]EGO21905.1 hypothetical protein SERLADRAFT_474951 [Serpula lacrymans var. lacrymans S7.9]